ncbi:MAG TPA: hypothetical protein VLQ93_01620 [Myxococcaceae bacterium]|nr:hypothetical protein [Myxococcaceae bacterium]
MIYDILANAQIRMGELRQSAESAGRDEEVALWRYVRDHSFFIFRTGQVYRFEDYLKSLVPARTSFVSAAFSAREDKVSQQAMALLLRTLQETTEPEQKQLMRVIIDMLNFVAETGQSDEFDEFRETWYLAPTPAIARFDTREQAEAWLNGLAEPPGGTFVLIGDEYHEVWYSREDEVRELLRQHMIEPTLEGFVAKGLPAAVASFDTREEAEEWLKSHPASPMDFVSIAGEHHLAVYHRKLALHTLHPLSSLKEWEEQKRKSLEEEDESAEEASSSEE